MLKRYSNKFGKFAKGGRSWGIKRDRVEIARFYIRNAVSEFRVKRKDLALDRILNGRLKITCIVNKKSAIRKTFDMSDIES